MQLIFVMETDSECKTDWIYIKETIEKIYQYNNAQIKLSPVYMAGRGNYKKKERRIKELISQYAASFKARKMINNVDSKSLGYTSFHDNTSNILNVLDRYLQRKE